MAIGGLATTPLAGCGGLDREPATRRQPSPSTVSTSSTSSTPASPSGTSTSSKTVLNMRDDLGCDPTGNSPCDEALETAVEPGHRLEFPPGQYRFELEHRLEGVDGLELVGTGEDRTEVQFVFPSGYSGIVLGLWYGRGWRLGNFTVQQSMNQRTGVGIELVPMDDLHVWDVEIAGFSPYNHHGGQRGLYCDVLEPDGVAVIDRYVHRDPSHVGNYPQGTQAFLADEHHRGTLYCRNWHLENSGENGLYASQTPGDVRVEGGVYRNNEVASIRVCGDGSYIRGATVTIDTEAAHPQNRGQFQNVRGIWWESGTFAKSGGFIENCELNLRSAPLSQGLVRIERTAGAVSLRNCQLQNQTPWATIDVIEPNRIVSRGAVEFTAEGLSIDATGGGRPILRIANRSGSSVTSVQLRSRSRSRTRDGIEVIHPSGITFESGSVQVGRFPMIFNPPFTTGECIITIDDRFQLDSTLGRGDLLIEASSDDSGTYCVSDELSDAMHAVAMTGKSPTGLHGHYLNEAGQIITSSSENSTEEREHKVFSGKANSMTG